MLLSALLFFHHKSIQIPLALTIAQERSSHTTLDVENTAYRTNTTTATQADTIGLFRARAAPCKSTPTMSPTPMVSSAAILGSYTTPPATAATAATTCQTMHHV